MAKEPRVPVTMLLKKDARTPEGLSWAQSHAAKLGLEPTSRGRASLCFHVAPADFKRLFGVEVREIGTRAKADWDFGAPSGFQEERPIPVPEELADYVELISVEPPAIRFDQPNARPG